MTYGTPPKETVAASARASGSAGASVHGPKLPLADTCVSSTLSVAASPTRPPTRYRFVPDCAVADCVRPSGSAISCGLACHGTTEPGGAGQSRPLLLPGHRLTGLMTFAPTSIVGKTVK